MRNGAKAEARKLQRALDKAVAQKAKAEQARPKRLTPRQERFVKELATDAPSGAEAARRAGYSEVGARQQAHENLTKPDIAQRLAELQRRKEQRSLMTREASQQRLLRLADTALELGQIAAAVRAEELAGRMAGLYVERNETVQLNLELQRMSAGDLQALMARVARRLLELSQGNTHPTPSNAMPATSTRMN